MNLFNQVVAAEKVKQFFRNNLEQNRMAHAYIFYGAPGRGKDAFAIELAKSVNCLAPDNKPCNQCESCLKINNFNHPDIKYSFPVPSGIKPNQVGEYLKEKAKNPFVSPQIPGHKSISIDIIRQLKNEAKYAPHEAKYRFFIFEGAEFFTREAANSFLKLLEEPPEQLYLILITSDLHNLLDTIRSRCQPLYFPSLTKEQIIEIVRKHEKTQADITPFISISQKNVRRIFELLLEDPKEKRSLIYDFLRAIAADNMFQVSEIVNVITAKRDKTLIMELLKLLLLWFRDVVHHQTLQDQAELINSDFRESIEKFSNFYTNLNLDHIIRLVESAYSDIDRNAHPALTLTNLAIEIQEQFSKNSVRYKEAV